MWSASLGKDFHTDRDVTPASTSAAAFCFSKRDLWDFKKQACTWESQKGFQPTPDGAIAAYRRRTQEILKERVK